MFEKCVNNMAGCVKYRSARRVVLVAVCDRGVMDTLSLRVCLQGLFLSFFNYSYSYKTLCEQ